MNSMNRTKRVNAAISVLSLAVLSACVGGPFDSDFRRFGEGGFDTSEAALNATSTRPAPDQRGVISYPGYQVAIARRGDTIDSIAARVGLPAQELAAYNAIPTGAVLRDGEVVTLPRRISETGGYSPSVPNVAGAAPAGGAAGGTIAVTTLAGAAIDRAAGSSPAATPTTAAAPLPAPSPSAVGPEPARHKVVRGESAYSIARLYNVNVKALADWNGLGSDLSVREGQILLIPVGARMASLPVDTPSLPGEGTATPAPPSAQTPLPKETVPAAAEPVKAPPPPDLGTTASGKFRMPVGGKIIRGYQKGKNDGIDIAASAGSAVAVAGDGVVAAITKDTKGVPVVVVRHDGNLLTVYTNIDGLSVSKGDKVKSGQSIAKVRASDPAFVHFEVRQGLESVDPMGYLQ